MMWRTDKAQRRDEMLLVAFAERLCADAAVVEVRPEFRSSLRSMLLTEAPATLTAPPSTATALKPSHRLRTGRRRMALATGLVSAILGLAGMVTASASALPGEALYPVKRTAERAELTFHRAPVERGEFHLELADRRLDEATRLLDRGPAYTELGVGVLEEFDQQAAAGSDALIKAYRDDNSRASIVTLNRFSAKAMRQLNALQSKLVDVTLPQVAQARERLSQIATMAARLCPDCDGNTVASAASDSSPATTKPKPPRTTATSPVSSGRVARTGVNNTSGGNRDESDDESDHSDDNDSSDVTPLDPVLPKPPALDEVKPPAVELRDTSQGQNAVLDIVDGVDDAIDIPSLDGEGELLNLDEDDD